MERIAAGVNEKLATAAAAAAIAIAAKKSAMTFGLAAPAIAAGATKATTAIAGLLPPGFASGGFPASGQMFLAREAGPELVGTMGSRSAVVNNDQIVESVSQGVYRAVRDAMPSQQASNVTVSIEPTSDLLGFFEYLSASIKRVDYLSGATI